jgi:soluble lytic murein transglycosylase-like protein
MVPGQFHEAAAIMIYALLARAPMLACIALLLVSSHDARCQIYASTEPGDGAIVLSNFKTSETAVLLLGSEERSKPVAVVTPVHNPKPRLEPSPDLRRLVDTVARQTQVSPDLIHAVIAAESGYDPKAVSRKGAIGLMQLLPATGKRFGAADLYSVEQNVAAGAGYLKWLMGMFGEDLELVLAAYNAGEQAVMRAGRRIPPYPETQAYVRNVLAGLQRAAPAAL